MSSSMCVFCDIASGEADAEIVFQDPNFVAFLDIRPVFEGHTLLIPRHHYEVLADLPEGLVGPLFGRVQMLSSAIPEAMGAEGTFVAINNKVSQSVPYLHVHVVPRRRKDGLRGFFWPRHGYSADGLQRTADAVRAAVAAYA